MPQFQSVRTAGKLSERVRAQIEQAILNGDVRVTEQLPTEADLGASFGVSRTVIREALQRLEAQGLVELRVGSGSYVVHYPMDQVQSAMRRFAVLNTQRTTFLHLLDLRMVIETETTGRLAQRPDPEAVADLERILDTMFKTQHDTHAFAKADMAFHVRIAAAAENPFFPTILEPLENLGRAYGVATYESGAVIERTCRDHAEILEAIVAGNAELARRRMRHHIDRSRAHFLELLSKLPPAEPR